jgi:hypothetical protein
VTGRLPLCVRVRAEVVLLFAVLAREVLDRDVAVPTRDGFDSFPFTSFSREAGLPYTAVTLISCDCAKLNVKENYFTRKVIIEIENSAN